MRRGRASAPPTPMRVSLPRTTSAMAIAKSPARRLNSWKPKRVPAARSGKRASTSNSSGASAVVMTPLKKSAAAMVRAPRTLRATSSASSVAATKHHSEAGSACARLPQNVPRVRIGWCATCRTTVVSSSPSGPATTGRSKALWRTPAPMRSQPFSGCRMRSAAMSLISMRWAGVARRSAIAGTRLWPPASTRPSRGPHSPSSASASSTVRGAWYVNAAGFTPSADADHAGFVRIARRMMEHRAGELGNAPDALLCAPFLQPLDQADHRRWVAEVSEAHFDRARAGEQVFDHILDLHDAAAADDRNLHRLRALVDHAQDDRLDAGTRDAAIALADARAARLDVDLEPEDGVRHGDGIGARLFRRFGDRGDLAGVRRELGPERLVAHRAAELHHLVGRVLVQREVAAAGLARRAGDVELNRVDARHAHVARHLREVLDVLRGDAADERRLELLVGGQLHLEKILQPFSRQADRIDHACPDLVHARPRTAGAVIARHSLRDDRAEPA